MTWDFLAANWPDLRALLKEYFPHASDMSRPVTFSDVTDLIADLARGHDLTLSETAELLDDMVLTAWAQMCYTSDVTHKMVASS
jgi:hypothetical protein